MVVYESENFELELLSAYRLLAVRWIGVLEPAELAKMIRQIVELGNKYAIENILLDASYVEAPRSLQAIHLAPVPGYFPGEWVLPTVRKIARVASGYPSYDAAILQQYSALWQFSAVTLEFKNFAHHYEAMEWLTDNEF